MHFSDARIQQLAYLDAVARLGHFGEAADEIGVSQPALSQGIRRLETIVGVALVEQDGRGRVLTPMGAEVAAFAAGVIADSVRLGERISAHRSGTGGTLRLGLVDAVALYLRNAEIARFRDLHREIELHMTIGTSGELLSALERRAVDVAVVVGPAAGFDVSPLAIEELFVYGPPVDDVAGIDRWLLYPAGSHTRAAIDDAFVGAGIRPTVDTESGNPSVLAQLTRLGAGWTVLPAGVAEGGPEPLPRIGPAFARRELVVARRPDRAPDPLVDVFVSAL